MESSFGILSWIIFGALAGWVASMIAGDNARQGWIGNIIVAIVAVEWVLYARTARASTVSEREKGYVEAARSIGVGPLRIVLRHLLPNILAPIVVIANVRFAWVIILEASLSFLGAGVPAERVAR